MCVSCRIRRTPTYLGQRTCQETSQETSLETSLVTSQGKNQVISRGIDRGKIQMILRENLINSLEMLKT
jgi:hypothetical protein